MLTPKCKVSIKKTKISFVAFTTAVTTSRIKGKATRLQNSLKATETMVGSPLTVGNRDFYFLYLAVELD